MIKEWHSCDVLIVSLKLEGQVCSSPVGTSTSPGGAFSDEAFHRPGSKVTAIKIRVGGEALDYIQVRDAYESVYNKHAHIHI